MMSYPLVFIIQFVIFTGLFIYFSQPKAKLIPWYWLLILQLICMALQRREVGDVVLFSGAGWHLRHKIDFYFIDSDHNQYPFFPLMIFLYAPLNYLTEVVLPLFTFSFYLKLFLLIALYYLAGQISNHRHRLQFLSSPITYSIVLFHGQTDVLLIAFLVLALKYLVRPIKSALALAVSIGIKTWSIFLLPVIVFQLKRLEIILVYLLTIGLFLFLDVFIYTRYVFGSGFRVVLPAVFKAGGPIGQWGWTYLIHQLRHFNIWFPPLALPAFLILFGLGQVIILTKKLPLLKQVMLTILLLYLVIPRWGIQYLLWLWPFIFLLKLYQRLPFFKVYLFISGLYLFVNYLNVAVGQTVIPSWLICPLGFILWLIFLIWFKFLLAAPAKPPAPVRTAGGK